MLKGMIYYCALILCSLLTLFVFYNMGTHFDNGYQPEYAGISYTDDIPCYDLAGSTGEIAVIKYNEDINSDMFVGSTYAALLIDDTDNSCVMAHNAHRRIYPASMTKLMTAMVVCDEIEAGNISLDEEITLNRRITFDESNVMQSALDDGCTITVRNLLYGLLIRSYNDYAVILAESIAGSVDAFAVMMNNKAQAIGATNSHFVNPHGLHDDNHYITAYDMYLIVNEANKYEMINEIDSYKTYSYYYKDRNNTAVNVDITPTNAFLSDKAVLPSNIDINTWKTGTTHMAGYCMTMHITISDKDYIIVAADSVSSSDLYNMITVMFNLTQSASG